MSTIIPLYSVCWHMSLQYLTMDHKDTDATTSLRRRASRPGRGTIDRCVHSLASRCRGSLARPVARYYKD